MKKYELTLDNKCEECKHKNSCGWEDITAESIWLDCKAFYYVFCELEKECRVPFGNSKEKEKYNEELEERSRPFLTPAMVTNGILSAELALKYLIYLDIKTFDCTHDICVLFKSLPDKHKSALTDFLKKKTSQNDSTLQINIIQIKNYFIDWRYFFEKPVIGYSNFMIEFIHTVYDYTNTYRSAKN